MSSETTVSIPSLDETDRVLLAALRNDGRASHRDLSSQTGLALATVNRRIRRMEQAGVIKGYSAIIDPFRVGWELNVIIGLRIDKGHLRATQEAIAKDPRVFSVYDVTGEWDGMVLARVRNRADLDDLAKTTLSSEHIQRTNTMVVLHTVQEDPIPAIPGPNAL
ncbi:MAG: Lrp/AsnC family transcriptional regulator [Thermoplasmatota archaeon]